MKEETKHFLKISLVPILFAVVLALFMLKSGGPHGNRDDSAEFNPVAVNAPLPSVFLEDLTWTEVRAALQNGFESVIIPTGGTEQNGPHLILGKHNYIVKETSGRIARELGKTLVAPVLSYVPEGDPGTKEGHMAFPGTISIRESTFAAVLEDAVRSLITHGFKNIYILGDSGGNQKVQGEIARKMMRDWSKQGIKVLAVNEYYEKALDEQIKFLRSRNFSLHEVGTHAGIRDTSELLFVHKTGVREDLLKASQGHKRNVTGVSGDPAKAGEDIGAEMLELKIKAALRQIKDSD